MGLEGSSVGGVRGNTAGCATTGRGIEDDTRGRGEETERLNEMERERK